MPKPYTPNDKWSQKAREAGFRARSVYKLEELDQKFKLLKAGQSVLDLGAAPGSWLQFTAQRVGPKGMVIGMDLQAIEPVADNVHLYKQDITDIPAVRAILQSHGIEKVDLVLSDLAPNTSGIRDVDQWRSIELSQAVVTTAHAFLKRGGMCVIKVLRGGDFDEFLVEQKKHWNDVRVSQVKASRDRSNEVYLILKN